MSLKLQDRLIDGEHYQIEGHSEVEVAEACHRGSQPTVLDTLEYIRSLTTELKHLAQQAGLVRLALILMLAEQEAREKAASTSVS